MDILNDYYPLYPPNPEGAGDSSESEEDHEHIKKLDNLNENRKRKKIFTIDDFCLKYNDDMWYIWNIIHDYSLSSNLLDNLTFSKFCELCYENSTKY
jgi:ATP-dependent exoDNAse (exonuclease V) beta subunit